MDTQLDIHHTLTDGRGRYWADVASGQQAEMTYLKRDDGSMVINHTGVPREFEGKGIALKLVKRAITDARAGGFKIVPRCPYVAAQFRRHPDWSDLLA